MPWPRGGPENRELALSGDPQVPPLPCSGGKQLREGAIVAIIVPASRDLLALGLSVCGVCFCLFAFCFSLPEEGGS